MIKIYRDQDDYVLQNFNRIIRVQGFSLDSLFQASNPADYLTSFFDSTDSEPIQQKSVIEKHPWQAPVENQEIWAAGVTYMRSKSARMEESEQSGGDHFYDLVYEAERPELFFKSTGSRARGHLAPVCIRKDSAWNVPEPELTLAINSAGHIFGYTIGNDMSSRSIEGENPLYLPQAKIYRGSCAIGPCLVVGNVLTPDTKISIMISRLANVVFQGDTSISQLKRTFPELADYLFRENEFPCGAYLMTGTGIVPDSGFTLQSGDRIQIQIEGLGVLENEVE
ncbi:MAG: 2-hydroxyhepta-2,4-diene-1,7-dioate isomerase [Planctomycetaceae bacterium]|nr:2-hydroxyhepta-2,4-diene-1,7-dioate isomerase [Planctomycetaceae bacterium]